MVHRKLVRNRLWLTLLLEVIYSEWPRRSNLLYERKATKNTPLAMSSLPPESALPYVTRGIVKRASKAMIDKGPLVQ